MTSLAKRAFRRSEEMGHLLAAVQASPEHPVSSSVSMGASLLSPPKLFAGEP